MGGDLDGVFRSRLDLLFFLLWFLGRRVHSRLIGAPRRIGAHAIAQLVVAARCQAKNHVVQVLVVSARQTDDLAVRELNLDEPIAMHANTMWAAVIPAHG